MGSDKIIGWRSIVIKKADKGSCMVIWDKLDYLMEAEKQLKDRKVYQQVRFSENILTNLVEKSNTMFKNLRRKGVISEKELKYFSFEYKKATNLGKLYLLPKIHKLSVSKMCLVDQLFLTAEHQLKKHQSFLTITLSQLCKVAGHISRILVIF